MGFFFYCFYAKSQLHFFRNLNICSFLSSITDFPNLLDFFASYYLELHIPTKAPVAVYSALISCYSSCSFAASCAIKGSIGDSKHLVRIEFHSIVNASEYMVVAAVIILSPLGTIFFVT